MLKRYLSIIPVCFFIFSVCCNNGAPVDDDQDNGSDQDDDITSEITGYGADPESGYSPADNHVYYLDANNGNDTTGDGSIGNPWESLDRVQSVMVSGDTVFLMDGNYGAFAETSASDRTDWITIKNYPGTAPVLTQIDIIYSALQDSYIRFDGIIIDTSSDGGNITGVSAYRVRHFELRNCDVSYAPDKYTVTSSVYLSGCSNALVYHNHLHSTMGGVVILNSENITIYGNHIHHLGGGTGVYYASGNANTIIEKNNVYDSLWIEGEEGAPDADHSPHGSGISIRSSNVLIKQNIFHDIGSTSGIRAYPGAVDAYINIIIQNNLLYDIPNCSNGALNINDLGANVIIRNNTITGKIRTDNQPDPGKLMNALLVQSIADGYDGSGISIYNNVIVGTAIFPSAADVSGNIIWSARNLGESEYLTDLPNNEIIVSALTHDFSNLITYFTDGFFTGIDEESDFASGHKQILDFTLTAGSPAIDYGDVENQPATSLGSIGVDGFIQDDGIIRDSVSHSTGCYEH